MLDCIVIGGGAAGLSAALVLGRAKMNVLVIDADTARNRVTEESHGYLTQDGISPSQFKKKGWQDLSKYPSVNLLEGKVIDIVKKDSYFVVTTELEELLAERIVLATGLQERLPAIGGLSDVYGKSVFSCPFCDGWELRDKKLAVIGENANVTHMAKLLSQWSSEIRVFTNGKFIVSDEDTTLLAKHGIEIINDEIHKIIHQSGLIQGVEMTTGELMDCEGGLVASELYQPNQFAKALGCELLPNDGIRVDMLGATTVRGIYAAGDSTWDGPTQLIVAAAAGHKAGLGIVKDKVDEKFTS